MTRIFSFASGNIWRWTTSRNINNLINYAKTLDISGFEITFASKEELYSFNLSEGNRSWLRRLDYVTIHAPFKLVRESENKEEVIGQLDIISRLYDDIDAKNVIIHPDNLPEQKMLKEYSFDTSTENLPPKEHITISDLRRILNKYPEVRLCLDVSHAYLWSKHETSKLINVFKDKIFQIHFSGTYKKRAHQSLRNVSKAFLSSIQPVKELDVPVVIEEDIDIKSLKCLEEEIKYIKDIFD